MALPKIASTVIIRAPNSPELTATTGCKPDGGRLIKTPILTQRREGAKIFLNSFAMERSLKK
jgi:hypothetical protein